MLSDIKKDADERMHKSIDVLTKELEYEGEHYQKLLICYPRGYHIYHDPKIGIFIGSVVSGVSPILPGSFKGKPPVDVAAATFPASSSATAPTVSRLNIL